jgi:imidazole glycerol-phosphate synthase subunit HisH
VTRIAILDYGMGNLRSVHRAVERVGGRAETTNDPSVAAGADAIVVPGVGAFGECMRGLQERGLDRVVVEFARSERLVLGVCLGLQVLFEGSEEDPDPGLALLPGKIRRLEGEGIKVPHMGWNQVRRVADHPFMDGVPDGTRFYFVHSYAPEPSPGTTIGETEHGSVFASIVASGSIFATQFHPEKSGEPGLRIYENFVRGVGA